MTEQERMERLQSLLLSIATLGGIRYAPARFVAQRLAASALVVLREVLSVRAYLHVVRCVWPIVAKTGHAIIIAAAAAPFPVTALLPNRHPFVERQKKGYPAIARAASLQGVDVVSVVGVLFSPSTA